MSGTLVPFVRADPRFQASTGTFDAGGNRLNAAPHDSVQASAQYEVDGVGGGKAFLRRGYPYQSSAFYDPSNAAITRQEAYTLLNAAIGWDYRQRWTVQLVGKNITDEQYLITIAANGAAPSGLAGAPRTGALQISKKLVAKKDVRTWI